MQAAAQSPLNSGPGGLWAGGLSSAHAHGWLVLNAGRLLASRATRRGCARAARTSMMNGKVHLLTSLLYDATNGVGVSVPRLGSEHEGAGHEGTAVSRGAWHSCNKPRSGRGAAAAHSVMLIWEMDANASDNVVALASLIIEMNPTLKTPAFTPANSRPIRE